MFTQQFIDYVHSQKPLSLKFMDEMGITLMNGNPNYGHSRRGTRCVDLTRYDRHANFTVSIIVGLTGIKYVSIIEGSFNTAELQGKLPTVTLTRGKKCFKEVTVSLWTTHLSTTMLLREFFAGIFLSTAWTICSYLHTHQI